MDSVHNSSSPVFHSLSTKYIIVIVVILATTMSIAAYLDYKMQKQQFTEQLVSKGTMLGDFVALVSPEAILGYDFVLMDAYMQEITKRQDVVYSVVVSPENVNITSHYDNKNPIIVKYQSNEILEILKRLKTEPDIINLEFPIKEDGDLQGTLLLGITTKRIDKISKHAFMERLSQNTVIIFILSLSIIFVFRYFALHPINSLIKSSRKIASGDLDHKAQVFSNDELGFLTQSFNNMTDSLKSSYVELNEKNIELVAATKAKSAFLANMSHEIRTPLTAIVGFGELLLDVNTSEVERRESINTIIRNGNHLQKIINDILDISKIEADKLEVELVKASPMEILKDIGDLVKMQAKDKNLDFEIKYQYPLPKTIITDPLRLKQILINLTSNAFKFTSSGKITIEGCCDFDTETMSFSVSDTGIGLSEDQQETVFEAFTQADVSTTREYGGTGLGLPLCKRLSEMLGGGIDLSSKIGSGSTFSFHINTGLLNGVERLESDWISTQNTPKSDQSSFENISGRVLLIDDNIENQGIVRLFFGKTDVQLTVVDNGKAVIETVEDAPFDLILVDMRMVSMDGCEIIIVLRNKSIKVPIVALTSDASQDEREKFSCAGCDDFITDQVDKTAFLNKIKTYLPVKKEESAQGVNKVKNGIGNTKNLQENNAKLNGHILLAEDTPDNQRLIRMFVNRLGLALTIVDNGKDAVDAALNKRFDLILMDMQMPIMGGLEAINILMEKACQTPIIAITANALKHDQQQYKEAGCVDFIAKPINQKLFQQTIQKHLSLPESEEEISSESSTKSSVKESNSAVNNRFVHSTKIQDGIADFNKTKVLKNVIEMLGELYINMESSNLTNSENEKHVSAQPLVSDLMGEDEEFNQAIFKFINGLYEIQKKINSYYKTNDNENLKAVIHQLKGAGGAFGFLPLSTTARQVEVALQNEDIRGIVFAIEEINTLCERIFIGISQDKYLSSQAKKGKSLSLKPISSQLDLANTEIAKTLEKFLNGLSPMQRLINDLYENESWDELMEQIHQLKGIGGAFGYPQLTEMAKEIYLELADKQFSKLNKLMADLNEIYYRIEVGRYAA